MALALQNFSGRCAGTMAWRWMSDTSGIEREFVTQGLFRPVGAWGGFANLNPGVAPVGRF